MIGYILVLSVVLSVVLSGFFAGSETGIYRLSAFRLRLGMDQKRPFYSILNRMMGDREGLILSTLVGTNLTHYLATSAVTYLFLRRGAGEQAAELSATAVMTPILFVLAELIPKNIYFHRADVLMPYLSVVLWSFHRILRWSGVIGLLKLISDVVSKLAGLEPAREHYLEAAGERRIQQVLLDSFEEGIVSAVQSDLLNRLMRISRLHIRTVMTGISRVQMLEAETDRSSLAKIFASKPFTHMPVYRDRRNNIIGFVNIYEALCSERDFADLTEFVRPIGTVFAGTTVIDGINQMKKAGQKIAMVTAGPRHGREAEIGIVTMKDLVEELTGELSD
ncbi:MAG: CNNM domain-containing protein [Planctomycetota bacterium]